MTQLRRQALSADLIIVNHHLFFADLALRAGGFGEVLPKPDIVVFDEPLNVIVVVNEPFIDVLDHSANSHSPVNLDLRVLIDIGSLSPFLHPLNIGITSTKQIIIALVFFILFSLFNLYIKNIKNIKNANVGYINVFLGSILQGTFY